MNLQEKIKEYKQQLTQLELRSNNIRTQIANLKQQGEHITAEGNKLFGAIEVLEMLLVEESGANMDENK